MSNRHSRLEGESIKEWMDRVSIPNSEWFSKRKRIRENLKLIYLNIWNQLIAHILKMLK